MQDEIESRIRAELADARIEVQTDGNRALVSVISARFEGLSRVQKHQLVYGCIEDLIQGGQLHAVTIRAEVDG